MLASLRRFATCDNGFNKINQTCAGATAKAQLYCRSVKRSRFDVRLPSCDMKSSRSAYDTKHPKFAPQFR
jgi:hypothetical protein